MNESLGLRSKKPPVAENSRPMWKKAAALQRSEDKLISERDVRRYCGKSQIKFPDRNTKRQSLVAEKSYDHEVYNTCLLSIYTLLLLCVLYSDTI